MLWDLTQVDKHPVGYYQPLMTYWILLQCKIILRPLGLQYLFVSFINYTEPTSTALPWQAVIKNADMAEDMQQDAIDCATQALEKYNIEMLGGWR